MIEIASSSAIAEYFKHPALNQSKLKSLKQGLVGFLAYLEQDRKRKTGEYVTPKHFIVGGAVDCILTKHKDVFDEEYYISSQSGSLTESEELILGYIYQEIEENKYFSLLEVPKATIASAIEKSGWQPRWKIETKVEKFLASEVVLTTFREKTESAGRTVISGDEIDTINRIVTTLRTNSRTARYFDRDTLEKSTTTKIFYQYPVYFSMTCKATSIDVPCKGLLDMLIAVYDKDGVLLFVIPVDLKTMNEGVLNFPSNFKRFGYGIQAAWYTEGLKQTLNCEVHPFEFVVESTTYPGTPVVYKVREDSIQIGLHGYSNTYTDSNGNITGENEVKGIYDLLSDYLWYQAHGVKLDRKIAENDFLLV